MKKESKAIAGLLRGDMLMLVVFLLAAVGMSAFVLVQVMPAVDSAAIKPLLIVVCAVSTLVLGGAMASVMMHLRKNKEEVYGEELYYKELARQQKEGTQ